MESGNKYESSLYFLERNSVSNTNNKIGNFFLNF